MPFATKPVRRYRAPKYPRFGYEISRVENRSFWSRLPKTKIVAAVISGALPLVGCGEEGPVGGAIQPSGPNLAVLEEADVREALLAAFTQAGLTITTDYQFVSGEHEVSVDGFDETKRVGYEFLSSGDPDIPAMLKLRDDISSWNAEGGPYFHVLYYNDYWYDCYESECDDYMSQQSRDAVLVTLLAEVDSFLDWLRSQGVI